MCTDRLVTQTNTSLGIHLWQGKLDKAAECAIWQAELYDSQIVDSPPEVQSTVCMLKALLTSPYTECAEIAKHISSSRPTTAKPIKLFQIHQSNITDDPSWTSHGSTGRQHPWNCFLVLLLQVWWQVWRWFSINILTCTRQSLGCLHSTCQGGPGRSLSHRHSQSSRHRCHWKMILQLTSAQRDISTSQQDIICMHALQRSTAIWPTLVIVWQPHLWQIQRLPT